MKPAGRIEVDPLNHQLSDRAHLDAAHARRGNLRGQLDGFVQVLGVDEVKTGELLLRLGKGTVRYGYFAVAHAHV